jgi:hypothetical protein
VTDSQHLDERDDLRLAIVAAAFLAVTSLWIGLATLNLSQHSDSLIPVLVSIQRWTPFYWGQDRFGMLVPLLTRPIRNPILNMVVQSALMTTASLAAPYVAARFLTTTRASWATIGTTANLLLLLGCPAEVRFDWLVAQPYGLALTLGFAALLVCESRSRLFQVGGFILLLLAHWVYLGISLIIIPALIIRRRLFSRSMTFAAISVGVGALAARLVAAPHTITATDAVSDWPSAWVALGRAAASAVIQPRVAVMTIVVCSATFFLYDRSQRQDLSSSGMAFAVALFYWLAVGTSSWVRMNQYSPRYVFPSLMFFGLALVIPSASTLQRQWSRITVVSFLGLALVAVAVYGRPSWSRLNSSMDAHFGPVGRDVAASNATVMAGDYWTVWPTVFYANVLRYKLGGGARVYGLTIRSEPTEELWLKRGARVMVAARSGDRSIGIYADRAGLELTHLGHRSEIELFVATTK